MKKGLLILGMLCVSALFFYQSRKNIQFAEFGYMLDSFSIDFDNKYPALTWSIENVNSLNAIEVLRSEDGSTWNVIEKLDKKLQSEFTFLDKNEFNNNAPHLYYQLKFIDRDANIEFSEIILTQPVIPHQAAVTTTASIF